QLAYMSMLKRGVKDISKIRPVNGFIITPGSDSQGRFHDSQILEGVMSISKTALRIQGGGLCSGMSKSATLPGFTFYQGKVYQEAAISVILGSELEIGYGVGAGAKPIANIGMITKIKDSWTIEEINQRPALEVFSEVFDKYTEFKKEQFIKDPGAVFIAAGLKKGYLPVLAESSADFFWPLLMPKVIQNKYIRCMTPIKQGTPLLLGYINNESAKKAPANATKLMIEDIDSKNFGFVFFFSCACRGMLLGKDYMTEIKKIKETLGNKDIPVFGIASTGESAFYKTGSPIGTGFTVTMLGISDESIFISKEAR
ncbi:FIST C-terminal domain-containing protein, partial [Candidatus Parcubacteria bacterium]|nr:FIST C-terminal domain-containing protein [Candidatus Parcubacteria bacterium]